MVVSGGPTFARLLNGASISLSVKPLLWWNMEGRFFVIEFFEKGQPVLIIFHNICIFSRFHLT